MPAPLTELDKLVDFFARELCDLAAKELTEQNGADWTSQDAAETVRLILEHTRLKRAVYRQAREHLALPAEE